MIMMMIIVYRQIKNGEDNGGRVTSLRSDYAKNWNFAQYIGNANRIQLKVSWPCFYISNRIFSTSSNKNFEDYCDREISKKNKRI